MEAIELPWFEMIFKAGALLGFLNKLKIFFKTFKMATTVDVANMKNKLISMTQPTSFRELNIRYINPLTPAIHQNVKHI